MPPFPSVHVVVPCYNYGRYLRGCVQSVLSQPGVAVRVLIVDDASTDDTLDVCRQLAREDPRVDYITHPTNKGHIATYNEGLTLADSDYVVLLSADDLLAPGCLDRATGLMERHPSVGLVYGNPRLFREADELPEALPEGSRTVWRGQHWIGHMCRSGRNFIRSPEAVMRIGVLRHIGGYDPALRHSADMEVWLRAAAVSDVGRVNGVDQAFYRVHGANMHQTAEAGVLNDLRAREQAFASAFAKAGAALPDAASLLAKARRSLALEAIRYALHMREGGKASPEAIAAYADFAATLCPLVAGTRPWRRLTEHHRATRKSPVSALSDFYVARRDDFAGRLAWHRWRRTGIY